MTKKATRARDPYAAFLRALRQTPRRWKVLADGRIRTQRLCPLLVVGEHGLKYGAGHIHAVMNAADRWLEYDPRLRARLLKACGVTERGR